MILIGIDTGVHTGVAVYDTLAGHFVDIKTLGAVEAMQYVATMNDKLAGTVRLGVVFEDARLRRWFGSKGREALQGAGSIKRDGSLWQDFLRLQAIDYVALPPAAGRTKWSAAYFKVITGYDRQTSVHARDAAVLVYNRSEQWFDIMRETSTRRS